MNNSGDRAPETVGESPIIQGSIGGRYQREPMIDPSLGYDRELCDDPRHAPCPDCTGEILVGEYETIRMPRLDNDGFPEVDPDTGELLQIDLPLPSHAARVRHSKFEPTAVRDA
jgi:hypothetical protein